MTPAERAAAVTLAYRAKLHPGDPMARLIWDDLAFACFVVQPTFAPGDALTMAHREGMRAAFLHIAAQAGITLFSENLTHA
jgi:hypothetical protein